MARSDTTSGLTQWAPLGLWTQSSSSSPSQPSADASDSIIVTTTSTTSPTMDGVAVKGNMSMSSTQSNMEGRVGKSGRRRSRASRRAPTTMLNTDTANFRSMVQQFTGIMSGPYPYPIMDPHSITGYSFNKPISVHRPSASASARAMPMELQQQQQFEYEYQYQNQYHAREQQQASQNQSFLPELNNSSAKLDQVGDEFFADAMYAQWMPTSRPTSDPSIKLDDDFLYY